MDRIPRSLHKRTFAIHLSALALMVIPPVLLYAAAQSGATTLLLPLMGLVVLGNILVLFAA